MLELDFSVYISYHVTDSMEKMDCLTQYHKSLGTSIYKYTMKSVLFRVGC